MDQAKVTLARADIMLHTCLNEDAGRAAYLACFHTAQAYIFERTDKVAKTHHGVQTEFRRLTRHDPSVDPDLRRFLDQAYDFKSAADYFTGPGGTESHEEAAEALETARRFVAHFEALVPTLAASSKADEQE